MHPNVTSHQRTLTMKLGPMPFEIGMQLENDLENETVLVRFPDLKYGITTRAFYNTSISAAEEQFREDGSIDLDNVTFTLITINE